MMNTREQTIEYWECDYGWVWAPDESAEEQYGYPAGLHFKTEAAACDALEAYARRVLAAGSELVLNRPMDPWSCHGYGVEKRVYRTRVTRFPDWAHNKDRGDGVYCEAWWEYRKFRVRREVVERVEDGVTLQGTKTWREYVGGWEPFKNYSDGTEHKTGRYLQPDHKVLTLRWVEDDKRCDDVDP